MKRRDFLKTTSLATLGSAGLAGCHISKGLSSNDGPSQGVQVKRQPDILYNYSAEDHRRRLMNIAYVEQKVRHCMRKHLIRSYLPGQCVYNLGEYPCKTIWDPDEWDEQELDRLQAHGIELIQVHEDWNDMLGLFGGNKYTAANPKGFRRFTDMVHRRGMKLIVYISTGFTPWKHPDFKRKWARDQDINEIYWYLAQCSPASPSWRAYVLPKIFGILDTYDVDGFYNDVGYVRLWDNPKPATPDEILAFEESPQSDGALADLLAVVYAEVKRRGGIVKVHASAMNTIKTDMPYCDYLWVGETIKNGDVFRNAIKNYDPYVVPCLDMSRATIVNEDELYLHAIPYMQFPLLLAGRPFTGERATIPGVEYEPAEKCFWRRHCLKIWDYYQRHPEGPHSYGWWDSCPGRPEMRPTHERWLKFYLPMVQEGTWSWLEVGDSDLFAAPLPNDVVGSLYANTDLYLVLANYSQKAATVQLTDDFVSTLDRRQRGKRWQLPKRTLQILQKVS